jgi:hypothetical protein
MPLLDEQLAFLNTWQGYRIGRVAVVTADIASPATEALVAATAGKRIRLLGGILSVSDEGSATQSSRFVNLLSASTIIYSSQISEQQPLALPYNQLGWCQTVAGEALNIGEDDGNATLAFGHICYVLVD